MPGIFDRFKKKDGNKISSNGNRAEISIEQAEKRMNRFKILVIVVGLLIFVEGSGLIYFANKYQETRSKMSLGTGEETGRGTIIASDKELEAE